MNLIDTVTQLQPRVFAENEIMRHSLRLISEKPNRAKDISKLALIFANQCSKGKYDSNLHGTVIKIQKQLDKLANA